MFGSKINPSGVKADLGDEIANSIIFDDGSSQALTQTSATAPSDDSIHTVHVSIQRCGLGTDQVIYNAEPNAWSTAFFDTSDRIYIGINDGGSQRVLLTTQVFRDTTSHYNLTFVYDRDNATNAHKFRVYNGLEEITAFATDQRSSISGSADHGWHKASQLNVIGKYTGGASRYADFYLSRFISVDGQALTPTSFLRASTSHPNVAVPINYAGTYGNRGFELDFEVAPGTGNGAGTDVSGNGNHFTDNNLTADDQSSDTPTNVFPTWNPLQKGTVTLSNGSLDARVTTNQQAVTATMSYSTGKFYWEVTANTSNDQLVGIVGEDVSHANRTYAPFTFSPSVFFYGVNGNLYENGISSAWDSAITATDVIGVAVDFDAGKIWFAKNNSWLQSGDPANDTNPAATFTVGTWTPAWSAGGASGDRTGAADFGQLGFTYTPPTGFVAPSQANLPNVVTDLGGVDKPYERIAIVTDTETNIEATLAAAEDWTDYIRWFKNITNVESHMVVFSDDSSNELSFDDAAAAKAAKRSLSGTDTWLGVSWRTGANYGCVTGTISHTNGAATTVTHSLSSSDVLIVLRRTDAGSQWFTYHPKLTSGDLVYLDALTGETLDAAITNLTSDAFDIDAGEPTGTYRYIVWRADPGYLDLGTHTGNAATDGVFITGTGNGALVILKDQNNTSAAGSWNTWLNVFDNANGNSVWLNTTNAALGNLGDTLSTGFKARSSNSGMNGAHAYINIMWHTSAIGGGIPFPNAR